MIDLRPGVCHALEEINGEDVYYNYPSNWGALPVVSYYEVNNSDFAQADGKEYLSDIAFQVDIWSKDPDMNVEKSLLIDSRLALMGLRREFSHDLFESGSGLHHRTMRYGCIAKQNETIYQK